MKPHIEDSRAWRLFWVTTVCPKTILAIGLVVIVAAAIFLPQITKDTRSEAFMPEDHPAVVYRDKVKEVFGLRDPMVVAVVNEGETGVFNPHGLSLVHWLTERIADVPGIDPDRITSLATQDDIMGTEDGMMVEPFFEDPPDTQAEADRIRESVMDFPLYLGSLVARDGTATLIVAELLDNDEAQEIYDELRALVAVAPTHEEVVYVAGEGAVNGYLGTYIDTDATRLNPIAALVITIVLFIAYRTLRGIILPNVIVLATVGVALGTMAGAGIPFYVITNALPVILIAIAVADSIHILAQYYEEMADRPDLSHRELVVRSVVTMWRPVTITSLTTAAGFMGIYAASFMPPMKAFGLFAALGVMTALVFSLFVLPAGLLILRPKPSPAFRVTRDQSSAPSPDRSGQMMAWLGRGVARNPGMVLILAALVAVAGIVGALRLEVNEDRIAVFQTDEPIYIADRVINRLMDGTSYLDVVIETPDIEGLFNPDYLNRIEALQHYLQGLPHVQGTTSIVDYLKQMNRAMNEDQLDAYRTPDQSDLVAQYFLLYSASGDPTDFEEEIDYDYRQANVRATMNSGRFTHGKVVMEAAEQYVKREFNAAVLTATLTGRVSVDYHWIKELAQSHFRSVGIALAAVWLMAALSFSSALAGLLAIVPVAMAVLLIYAIMGFFGIWLAIGTSMFAAIAIGVGVDFSVHTIDRLKVLIKEQGRSMEDAFSALFPSTGRALLFNFAAILLGFGVLITSQVPPLIRFGSLVGVAVSVSFVASMTVLPALIKVLQPSFLKPSAIGR